MRVSKVNYNPTTGRTHVEYETRENDGRDTVTHDLRSDESPHPSLVGALAALRAEIESLCRLPSGYVSDVRGASVHRVEDDDGSVTESVTFTATKALPGIRSPLVLNTPTVPLSDYPKVVDLLGEAALFVKGRRAQSSLLEGPAAAEKPKRGRKPKAEPLLPADAPAPSAEAETPKIVEPEGQPVPHDGSAFLSGYGATGNRVATLTVDAHTGLWTGRSVAGEPLAIDLPLAQAKAEVRRSLGLPSIGWSVTPVGAEEV